MVSTGDSNCLAAGSVSLQIEWREMILKLEDAFPSKAIL